jgi:hypothetical protein
MVHFRGTLDRESLLQALRLQGRGLIGMAVMFIVFGGIALLSANFSNPASWGGPLFLVVLGVLWLAMPRLSARRQLKTNALFGAPLVGSADEERFIIETEFGHSTIPWAKFHRAVVGPKIALLFTSAAQFYAIADRFFEEPAQWDEFKRLVTQQVPRQARPKGAFRALLLWVAIIVGVFLIWSLFQTR